LLLYQFIALPEVNYQKGSSDIILTNFYMKKLSMLILITILCVSYSTAQELSVGADIFNRYIWRGLDLGGKSPNIQPWMKLSFDNENHSFSIGAWGAFSIAGTANEETDLYLSYTYKSAVTFTLTDYFFPGLNTGAKENYFEWGKDSTGHILEGTVAFNGTEKIPFTLIFAMNFYGNDARKANGDIFMSKYIELGYKTKIKETDFNLFIGAALDKADTDNGETTFYLNENPGIVNLGIKASKTFEITEKFSLPVQCSIITNPELNKIYMAFGISF
jgi:hypothetical protein